MRRINFTVAAEGVRAGSDRKSSRENLTIAPQLTASGEGRIRQLTRKAYNRSPTHRKGRGKK